MDLLRIPLAKLGQGPIARSVVIEDPNAEFGELPLGLGAVAVEVEVSSDAADGVRAHGVARARLDLECRRCLTPTIRELEVEFGFWYRPPADVSPGEEAVWPLDQKAGEVDLTEGLREELWIAVPAYLECDPVCAGLCPRCGVRLPDEPCSCPPPEPDPRWAALRGTRPE